MENYLLLLIKFDKGGKITECTNVATQDLFRSQYNRGALFEDHHSEKKQIWIEQQYGQAKSVLTSHLSSLIDPTAGSEVNK